MRFCLSILVASTILLAPIHAQVRREGATLLHVEGDVYLNDRIVESNSLPTVLPDPAVLRTSAGRAAIALKRGGMLFLDRGASVRVLGNGVYHFNRIEVLTGSAIVATESSAPLVDCESDIRLSDRGRFRFDVKRLNADERQCNFRVFEGAAAVPLATVTNALRAGQSMGCNRRCGDMIPTMEFSPEVLDEFDKWARQVQYWR